MERRRLLAVAGAGLLVGSNGCLEYVQDARATTDGSAADIETGSENEGVTGDDDKNDETNGDEGSDRDEVSVDGEADENDDELGNYSITEYERLEDVIIPSVFENEHSHSTASWIVTSEAGGQAVVEEVTNSADWGIDSMVSFIDETDFSESVLLYANAWGSQTCVLLETVDVKTEGDSVHLVVEKERDPEMGCGEAMSQRSELVRVTFEGATPETGHITYRESDRTEAAIDVED